MERRLLIEKVKNILENLFPGLTKLEFEQPIENWHLRYDMSLDSLQIVQLMMAIEDEFSLHIDEAEFYEKVETFGNLIDFIAEKIS